MRPRSDGSTVARRSPVADGSTRLDRLVNPYGPSLRVLEAIASSDELHLPAGEREDRLRDRLAQTVGLPAEWLTLANGIDELLTTILLWRRERGPLVVFPPADAEDERRGPMHGLAVVRVPRSHRFAVDLDPATCGGIPARATALVTSPNDPTGTLLGTQDAVRLARCCEIVLVDERHGEYSGRSVLPLVREFDNIVVLRTFETWAGLAGLPFAYAIAPPRLTAQLGAFRPRLGIPVGSVIAAEATLADLAYVRATVQRVAAEKSRLYRTLRKLNMIRPFPSWANFMLARVERGSAGWFHGELARRGILVHRPPHPELADFLRISATAPEATLALKRALIEIAAAL